MFMSAHWVPPQDKRQIRMDHLEKLLAEKIAELTSVSTAKKIVKPLLEFLRPYIKLPEAATKGATIMTEAAATNKDGRYLKAPENL